ncbi:MAG TPA: ABC transporter permease [Polyangiaceae bacterium]
MTDYVIRRLLIMIPTFFGISLIIFVVLNLAPGRPGAQNQAEGLQNLGEAGTQESFQIFREQFNLDKPTLFNTRFLLTLGDIEREVRIVAQQTPATASERIAAYEQLEDWGAFAVPPLIELMNRSDREDATTIRDFSVFFLSRTARRPLIDPYEPHPSPEIAAQNRAIDLENALVRELRYPVTTPEADKQKVIAAWRKFYAERASRYRYSFGEKVRTLFLETRFAKYWANLLKLDFGVSLVTKQPVLSTLVSKLKYSLSLSVLSLILAYSIAIPLGIYSAVYSGTRSDRTLTVGLFMLYSLPSFFVATVLLYAISEGSDVPSLRWFPTGGWQSADAGQLTTLEAWRDIGWHLVLPLFCMTYGSLAAISRYMRSGLLEVIRSDYIRTARAKGLSERVVIGKHAVKNGLLPILTLLAGLLPAVLGGSVIIEYIFGIPGLGLWVVDSIYQRDYNVLMGVQLLTTVLVLVGILLTDLSYALVDPRIRYQ